MGEAEGVYGEGWAVGAVDGPEYNAGDGGEEDEDDDEECCPETARAEAAAVAAAGWAVYGALGVVELRFFRRVCSAVCGGAGGGAVECRLGWIYFLCHIALHFFFSSSGSYIRSVLWAN